MNLDLKQLRELSVRRAIEGFKTYENVPITFWSTALAGEMGELCNMIAKLERVKHGGIDAGSSYTAAEITPDMMSEEIGGIAIYLNLLASLLGISLEDAIIETFNSKSRKYNFNEYLTGDKWISVEKELPKKFKNVLALSAKGQTRIACVDSSGAIDEFELEADGDDHYTHWHPLPEPPKQKP